MLSSEYSRILEHNWSTPQDCKLAMAHAVLLADSPGVSSFMDDIDRIVAKDYKPSDQDIVKARLRTTNLEEHRFSIRDSKHLTLDTSTAPWLTLY